MLSTASCRFSAIKLYTRNDLQGSIGITTKDYDTEHKMVAEGVYKENKNRKWRRINARKEDTPSKSYTAAIKAQSILASFLERNRETKADGLTLAKVLGHTHEALQQLCEENNQKTKKFKDLAKLLLLSFRKAFPAKSDIEVGYSLPYDPELKLIGAAQLNKTYELTVDYANSKEPLELIFKPTADGSTSNRKPEKRGVRRNPSLQRK